MKVLLGCLALVIFVLGNVDAFRFMTTGESVVPFAVNGVLRFVAFVYLVFAVVLPAIIGRQAPRASPPAEPPIALCRCGARFRFLGFWPPMVGVTVYTDRLTIRPLLMREYTILVTELVSISEWRGLFNTGYRIDHAAPGLVSPFKLFWLADDVLASIQRIHHDLPRTPPPPTPPPPTARPPTPPPPTPRPTTRSTTRPGIQWPEEPEGPWLG